jgi:DNA-binding CsgD family transcriptional regulator
MSEEYPDIDEIIARLYEAALDDTPWPAVMTDLATTLKLRSASLLIVDHATGGIAFDCSAGLGTSLEDVAEGGEAYRHHYAGLDYRRAHIEQLPTGSWSSCHKHFGDDAVKHSEFFNDYVRRWDLRYLTGARVARTVEQSAFVGLMRSEALGPIAGTEQEFLARLAQHLSRALALHLRQRTLRQQLRFGLDALNALDYALCVVRDDGVLLFANAAAEVLLGTGRLLRIRGGRLVTAQALFSRELDDTIRLTAHTGVAGAARIALAANSGGFVSITTLRLPPSPADELPPGSKVLVALQVPSRELGTARGPMLRRLYRLSEREAELAEMLAGGVTPTEYAALRGVKIATVRTQIQSILRKVGVRRQVDLVRVLAGVIDGRTE